MLTYTQFKTEIMNILKEKETELGSPFIYALDNVPKANVLDNEVITVKLKEPNKDKSNNALSQKHHSYYTPMFRLRDLYGFYFQYELIDPVVDFIENEISKSFSSSDDNSDIIQNFISNASDYDSVCDHFYLKLLNYEKNEEYLRDKIYDRYEDLAIVYAISIPTVNGINSSVTISKSLFELWDVNKTQIYQKALTNMDKESYIQSLGEKIHDLEGDISLLLSFPLENEELLNNEMFFVSNLSNFNGASYFLTDSIQNQLLEIGKSFYILPSSIHEMIFVVADKLLYSNEEVVSEMESIIHSVNKENLNDKDFLSDHAYFYDAVDRKFILASKRPDKNI